MYLKCQVRSTPVNNIIVLDNVSTVGEMLCYNIGYDQYASTEL